MRKWINWQTLKNCSNSSTFRGPPTNGFAFSTSCAITISNRHEFTRKPSPNAISRIITQTPSHTTTTVKMSQNPAANRLWWCSCIVTNCHRTSYVRNEKSRNRFRKVIAASQKTHIRLLFVWNNRHQPNSFADSHFPIAFSCVVINRFVCHWHLVI